jgi:hypothetical protein
MREATQMMLHETPARFDGTEVGRVCGQKKEGRAGGLDELTHDRSVMGSQVVEDNHVAGIEAGRQRVPYELDEARSVDGAGEDLMAQHAIGANGADDRKIFAPVCGLVIIDAVASQGAPVQPDSSSTISRSSGIWLNARRNATRCAWTLGRPCSDGRKRFFPAEAGLEQRSLHRRATECDAVPPLPFVS